MLTFSLTFFEATLGLMLATGQAETVVRIQATVAWVRQSCEDDLLPTWLTEQVVRNFEMELLQRPQLATVGDGGARG